MGGSVEEALRDKASEVRERLADAVETARRNVREGIRAAVTGRGRKFGRPPSGRPPWGRPPSLG